MMPFLHFLNLENIIIFCLKYSITLKGFIVALFIRGLLLFFKVTNIFKYSVLISNSVNIAIYNTISKTLWGAELF